MMLTSKNANLWRMTDDFGTYGNSYTECLIDVEFGQLHVKNGSYQIVICCLRVELESSVDGGAQIVTFVSHTFRTAYNDDFYSILALLNVWW